MVLTKPINNLIVSGCSFTHGYHGWASILSKHFNSKLINLAVPGAGNQHIARSIILYLEKHQVDVESTLIVVMWSNPSRADWLISRQHQDYSDYHRCSYGNNTHLIFPGQLLQSYQIKGALQPGFPELLDIAYSAGRSATATIAWESINNLNMYLKNHKYRFLQTAYFDPYNEIPKNFGIDWMTYTEVEQASGLGLPMDNWVPLDTSEYLGNYACQNNLLQRDTVHPTDSGYAQWANKILIPKLATVDNNFV
jgi:hypothetical protein